MVDEITSEQSYSASEIVGIPRASEGIKSLVSNLSRELVDEEIRDIDSRVERVMGSDLPTAHAIEETLRIPDHGKKILFLAKFSDSWVKRALTGIGHEEESADRASGFFLDMLGIILKNEMEKRSRPQDT